MLSSFFKPKLLIRNVLTGKSAAFSDFPVYVGGTGAHFEVEAGDRALFEIRHLKRKVVIEALGHEMIVSGVESQSVDLLEEEQCTVVCGGHFLLLAYTKKAPELEKKWAKNSWRIVDANSNVIAGPFALSSASKFVPKAYTEHPGAIFQNEHSTSGFYLGTVMELLGLPAYESTTPPSELIIYNETASAPSWTEIPAPQIDTGEFTCSYCWLKFDRGDVKHIAAHKSLRGDYLLGDEHQIRFHDTSFNDKGHALDAMGSPCPDIACPHCHRKLPPGFLHLKPKILSIVGAPASGKSYYLCVLVKRLTETLSKFFGIAFYSTDPTAGVLPPVGRDPIDKTALEGDMYVSVWRISRWVKMPRPFIFTATPEKNTERATTIIFYDNAGEHFEPGRDSEDSPGAQHIAAAEGIFFMFDPTYSLAWRKILKDSSSDPQIKDSRFDQQETILAETNARVKTLKGVPLHEKISTPLAIIVGKCDVWQHLVGPENLKTAAVNGTLDIDMVKRISELVRSKLLDVTPAIVRIAEIISDNVMYFPVSSFGCSPELRGTDPVTGHPILSPDPKKISPILIEIPTLWVLSQMNNNLIPSKGER
jgi:hypothetical protein